MAQNLKDTSPGEGHNSELAPEERAKAIREHDKVISGFEDDGKAIATKKKKANQEFKAKTGMTIADFMAARRWASMEDEGEKREKMTNMQECYNALSTGDQLNWIEAAEKEDKGD